MDHQCSFPYNLKFKKLKNQITNYTYYIVRKIGKNLIFKIVFKSEIKTLITQNKYL